MVAPFHCAQQKASKQAACRDTRSATHPDTHHRISAFRRADSLCLCPRLKNLRRTCQRSKVRVRKRLFLSAEQGSVQCRHWKRLDGQIGTGRNCFRSTVVASIATAWNPNGAIGWGGGGGSMVAAPHFVFFTDHGPHRTNSPVRHRSCGCAPCRPKPLVAYSLAKNAGRPFACCLSG